MRERCERFGDPAKSLIDPLEQCGAEAGGECLARQIDQPADGFDAQTVQHGGGDGVQPQGLRWKRGQG